MCSQQTHDPDSLDLNIKFGYLTLIIGILGTAAAIGLCLWISIDCNHPIPFRDYIDLFATGMVITTLAYTALGLKQTHKGNMQKLTFEKKKFEYAKKIAAMDVCAKWHSEPICGWAQEARRLLQPYKDPNSKLGKLNDRPMARDFNDKLDDPAHFNDRKALMGVLNYFEHISLLMESKLVDSELVKDAFWTLFCDYYENLGEVLNVRREKRPRAYENFLTIAREWHKMRG